MPPRLPTRVDMADHSMDAPLTQVGLFMAGESGRAFSESGVHFSACYVSPALRCVQTACQLLKSAEQVCPQSISCIVCRVTVHIVVSVGYVLLNSFCTSILFMSFAV